MTSVRFLFCLVVAMSPLMVSAGDNWTEFRGPNGVGVVPGADLPAIFSETENVLWKTAIPGWGHASPVVFDGQIWLATATEDGLRMSAVCVDAESGQLLKEIPLFENESVNPGHHPTNSYASCTPAIEAGRVYFHFGHYGTACLDTQTGHVLWQRRDIEVDEYRGPGSSPILFENLLIINFDGIDKQFVMALDKLTGNTIWKKDRTIDYGAIDGDLRKGYGTPAIFPIDGRPQLVSPTAVGTITYDPRTGEEIWSVRHGGMNAAARPLYANGLVYIAAGKDDSMIVAVKPGSGDLTNDGIAWKSGKMVSMKPSPLLIGNSIYMVTDAGIASCRDATTGEIHWVKRLNDDFWGSPVSDGKKIFAFSTKGKAVVFAADEKNFTLLAENQFEEDFHATPAIVGNAMFLRGRHHLYRIERK